MFEKLKINKKYLSIGLITLIIGVILVCVYQISRHAGDIFLTLRIMLAHLFNALPPIIYAFIISYILYRPLLFLEKWWIKGWKAVFKKEPDAKKVRLICLLLLILSLLGSLFLLIQAVVPPLVQNLLTIGADIPHVQMILTESLSKLAAYFKSLHITDDQIHQVTLYITGMLSGFLKKMFASGTGMVTNVATFCLNLFATLILTFYFLKDKEIIFDVLDKVSTITLKPTFKLKLKHFIHDVHQIFGGFVLGQLLDALLVGIASTILLFIIGHPFALLIGFIAGVMNVIPYIGPMIGATLAIILGLFTDIKLGLLGAALLIIYQQIDGNFIQPKILGDSTGLAPVWIFMAILIGGNYFGTIGMILSVPVLALIKVYLSRRLHKIKKETPASSTNLHL